MEYPDRDAASRILRVVPNNKAFFFFTDIGHYTGKLALSLTDFYKKINTIDKKSVDFHFRRQDFEKWIRETIGDVDLANRISEIRKSIQGEKLRVKIYETVEQRLTEVRILLASEEADLGRI